MVKIPKFKKLEPIEIVWYDTFKPATPSWINEDDHEDGGLKIRTVALFWSRDKSYIYTYGSVTINEEFRTLLQNPFHIPIGCIKSISKLSTSK